MCSRLSLTRIDGYRCNLTAARIVSRASVFHCFDCILAKVHGGLSPTPSRSASDFLTRHQFDFIGTLEGRYGAIRADKHSLEFIKISKFTLAATFVPFQEP
jgi:hypothetical protein